jgi:hypothetical protein
MREGGLCGGATHKESLFLARGRSLSHSLSRSRSFALALPLSLPLLPFPLPLLLALSFTFSFSHSLDPTFALPRSHFRTLSRLLPLREKGLPSRSQALTP